MADSHYNEKNHQFLIFLEKVKTGEIRTSQLFLMGDMIDFISGESKYFIKRNKKILDLLNELSNDLEIIYLEGNHDYNMQVLFSKIKVIKRENQPLEAKYQDKIVALAHGDIFTPWHYNLYCSIIRNSFLLKFLNILDINNFISKKIYYSLLKKNICSTMNDFESFAKRRLYNYTSNIVIEGHFHQGKSYVNKKQNYVNIPSLCCSNKYFILKENNFEGVSI